MKIPVVRCLPLALLLVLLAACRPSGRPLSEREESREAKALMQGLWVEEETGDVFFKMQGDTVYFPDSLSQPSVFRVVGDTLYIGQTAAYHIERQSEHVLWFKNQNGETIRLQKTTAEEAADAQIETAAPKIQTLSGVLKRDTVVMVGGRRYHCYIAINPTRYRVVRTAYNEEGMQVDRVYYDNIVHISIFEGSRQLFSRDFRKQLYRPCVPGAFLEQAILSNMEYTGADEQGFHFTAQLCYPDAASCYQVDNVITSSGQLSTNLIE
ncbi:MAG: DUF4738 domain-containing protein [Prevotella sp.]|nr:DUF4738 domain-containing protein [Prevotella sp.]